MTLVVGALFPLKLEGKVKEWDLWTHAASDLMFNDKWVMVICLVHRLAHVPFTSRKEVVPLLYDCGLDRKKGS